MLQLMAKSNFSLSEFGIAKHLQILPLLGTRDVHDRRYVAENAQALLVPTKHDHKKKFGTRFLGFAGCAGFDSNARHVQTQDTVVVG